MSGSASTQQHREKANSHPPARVAVLTISDTRTPDTDTSGGLIREKLLAGGHSLVHYEILPDEPHLIRARVLELARSGTVDAILTNGGTGIAPRDGTFEAISSVLTKVLPGFGEIFRMLSWHEVGAASMLSRAIGGLCDRTLVFAMPGSSNAVQVAMDKLIVPELAHLVWEISRK
ncbi:molybdenum cofactor biosynthesis protein [bacterium]|nr:molybdenum cofactor biosynthesis protein [bacterium]